MIAAIASGKGGVGKTWLAITLAHALARQGRRVLLVDGDMGLANVDVQLGLMPTHTITTALDGTASLAECATPIPEAGFHVAAGRSGCGALAATNPEAITSFLGRLDQAAAAHDVVLVDLGAGLDAVTRRLAAAADRLFVIATDEPTSLTDAYAVLKLHAGDCAAIPRDARLIINRAASHAAGARTAQTLQRACARFLRTTPTLAGVIRQDPAVPRAIRAQVPLLTRYPTSPAASDVEAIARSDAW